MKVNFEEIIFKINKEECKLISKELDNVLKDRENIEDNELLRKIRKEINEFLNRVNKDI